MTFTVVTIEDTTEEPDETFTVTLSGATNATISATDETATGTITDDDAAVTTPTLSIANAEGNEAVGVAFTVTLSEAVADEVTTTWTASIGSGDTAVAADLGATKTGTVTVMANATTTTFTVPVADDATDESDETFTVTLSGVSSNAQLAADPTARGTIEDDDPEPTLSVADASATEGGAVAFTVRLSPASGKQVTVDYKTSVEAGDTATEGTDFTAASSTLTFMPGDESMTFTVVTIEDTTDEDDETFTVTLSGATNATISATDETATGTITDDDAAVTTPTLSIADAEGNEAVGVAFTVTLSAVAAADVTATWTASIGSGDTAVAADLGATKTGPVSVMANATTTTFTVPVANDATDEDDETFTVTLSGVSSNAQLAADATARGRIEDDDPEPTLSVADASATEGGAVAFTVRLSPASGKQVTVDYKTSVEAGDTATEGTDFTAASSTLTFMPGDESMTFTVVTIEDTTEEPDETFTVTLSGATNATISATDETATGTITDDDATVTTPTLGIANAEGNEAAGVEFTVTLSEAVADEVTATWTASIGSGDTAVAADLGATKTGTVTVAMNATTTTFTVPVADDATDEDDETFTVTLSNATNATLSNGQTTLEVIGTIEDDDTRGVTVSKTEFTFREGREETYEVVLDTQPTGPVTVRVTVSGSPEVTAQPSRLWFTADDWFTAQTVTVRAAHDDDAAADEATVTHAVAGADYGSNEVTAAPVSVSVEDDDTPSVTVSETAIEFREGGSATYTVMLDTQPSGPVTVRPSVRSVAGVTVSPSSLRFTPSVRGVAGVTVSPSQLTFTRSTGTGRRR